MEDIKYLKKWANNISEKLIRNKKELKTLEENREQDLEKYSLYATKIREWLEDKNLSAEVKEELSFKLQWLDNQEGEIDRKIRRLKAEIKTDEFIIDKLN